MGKKSTLNMVIILPPIDNFQTVGLLMLQCMFIGLVERIKVDIAAKFKLAFRLENW